MFTMPDMARRNSFALMLAVRRVVEEKPAKVAPPANGKGKAS